MKKFINDLANWISLSPNSVYKWMPSDTKELYEENLKNNRGRLQKLGWLDRSITYHVDSLSLRNKKDLELGKSYTVFLGCSHTYGIGLPEESVWTHHVAQHIDTECYNAALAGHGIDGCYRMLYYILEKGYTVKNVFMLAPDSTRIEYFDKKSNRWNVIAWWTKHHLILAQVVLHSYFTRLNYQKTYDAIYGLCAKHNINLIDLSVEDPDVSELMRDNHNARDLMHPGEDAQRLIAEKFIEKYNNSKFP